MDILLRDRFTESWEKYFPGSDLPVSIEFKDNADDGELVETPRGWRCIICQIAKARSGDSIVFTEKSITCGGGLRYSGYSDSIHLNFRYFLSYGKKGIIDGERYKQTPEIVDDWEKQIPKYPPHKKYLHIKRWDKLKENDNPEVIVFFARPELYALRTFGRRGVVEKGLGACQNYGRDFEFAGLANRVQRSRPFAERVKRRRVAVGPERRRQNLQSRLVSA